MKPRFISAPKQYGMYVHRYKGCQPAVVMHQGYTSYCSRLLLGPQLHINASTRPRPTAAVLKTPTIDIIDGDLEALFDVTVLGM